MMGWMVTDRDARRRSLRRQISTGRNRARAHRDAATWSGQSDSFSTRSLSKSGARAMTWARLSLGFEQVDFKLRPAPSDTGFRPLVRRLARAAEREAERHRHQDRDQERDDELSRAAFGGHDRRGGLADFGRFGGRGARAAGVLVANTLG